MQMGLWEEGEVVRRELVPRVSLWVLVWGREMEVWVERSVRLVVGVEGMEGEGGVVVVVAVAAVVVVGVRR